MKSDFDIESLISFAESQLPVIVDALALKGLEILKSILDEYESPYLKNYSIWSESHKTEVTYFIELDKTAITDESRRKMRKETETMQKRKMKEVRSIGEAKDYVRTYMMGPDGRPERIVGSRKAAKPRVDKRKPQRDARKTSADRNNITKPKESGERYVDHELYATAPRGIEIEPDGRLRITLQREVRNTNRGMIMPNGQYQGVMKDFLEQLSKKIAEEFVEKFSRIQS